MTMLINDNSMTDCLRQQSKGNSIIKMFAVLFVLSICSGGAFAESFSQTSWDGGVIDNETACTTANGSWSSSECLAGATSNQTGWNAFSSSDAGVLVVNTGEDLQLDHAAINAATIVSSPYNTNDRTATIEIIKWNETLPASTDIQFQIRTAADNAGQPGQWSSWMGPDGSSNSFWNSVNTHDGNCSGSSAITCTMLPDSLTIADSNQWLQVAITLESSVADTATLADFEVIYSTGRLAQWRFDGSSDDLTYRGRNAVLSADAMYIVDSERTALSADGLDGYANASGFVELGVSSPYTFEAWVKLDNGVTDGSVIHFSETSNGRGLCYSPISLVDGKFTATSFDGSALNTVTASTNAGGGAWHYLATTWDATNGLTLYVNGVSQGSSAQPTLGVSSANMYVHLGFDDPSYTCLGDTGSYYYGLPYDIPVFHGLIDDVSVYNTALDVEIIAARASLAALPIAPVFDSTPITGLPAGNTYTYEVLASDQDSESTAISTSVLPSWLTLTDYGNGYAVLTGTTTTGEVGIHDVTLSVSDGLQTSEQSFQIAVFVDAPFSHWTYDGNLTDHGTNSNTGTFYSGAAYDATGLLGQAVTLDGVNDYVYKNRDYYFGRYNTPYTYTGWINLAPGETDGNVLYVSYSSWCYVPISVVGGKLVATSKTSTGSVVVADTETLQENTWYHFATSWDASSGLSFYLNGELVGNVAQATFNMGNYSSYLYVGFSSTSTTCNGNTQSRFAGKVDDVRMYTEAISAAQVAELYYSVTNNKPTGAITVDGTPTEEATLYANTAVLSDPDGLGALSYQWKRSGRDISGATSDSHTLMGDDVDHAITLSVSFTDGGGFLETVISAPTTVVANVNDLPAGTVDLIGNFLQGQTISAQVNISDEDGLGFFNYQWYRDGAPLTGENLVDYVLQAEDVGKAISVAVSYTDGHDTIETAISADSPAIANINDLPVGNITISGIVKEDQLLTASHSVTDIDGISTVSYQWLRNNENIVGATSAFYTPEDIDVGQKLSARMSYTDGHGTQENVTSAQTVAVANNNDKPSGTTRILGDLIVGETVSVDAQLIDNDGLGSFSYAWRRSSTGSTGVTGDTYVITEVDIGSLLMVDITYLDGYGTLEKVTATTNKVVENYHNEPPIISAVQDVNIEMNKVTGGIRFELTDDKTPFNSISVSVYSQNTQLIPDNNISISKFETGYELSLTPKQNAYGTLEILIRANDGTLQSEKRFNVTVFGQDTDIDGIPDLADLDDDNDGIPDSYELANGMNPLDASDAELDSDGDGVSNINQYLASNERDLAFELRGTTPTIDSPADVLVNATGLYTVVELGQAIAHDALQNEITAYPDQEGPFRTGTHTITWTAADVAGNTATAQQTVKVNPIVNFAKSQTVDEGTVVQIVAKLNGPAANYPVTIPYSVSGSATNPDDHKLDDGNIVIESGLEGKISVEILEDGIQESAEETLIIEMGEPENAVKGSIISHTVSIVEFNVPPNVTLQAIQHEQETTVIAINSGEFVLTVDVKDPNRADTHSFDWSLTDNMLVDIDEVDETFTIDTNAMLAGVYTVRLTVSDNGSPAESSTTELMLNLVDRIPELSESGDADNDGISDMDEGLGDDNGNRIPNYLDSVIGPHMIPLVQSTNSAYLAESSEDLSLRLGKTAFAASDNRASVTVAQIDKHSDSQTSIDSIANIGGYVDVEIYGILKKGAQAKLVIPQLSEIPENAVLRILKSTGWENFSVDASNVVSSAPGSKGYCPAPGDESYTEGLAFGHWCVQITLVDGGINDADGLANAEVFHLGGVGKTAGNSSVTNNSQTASKASIFYLLFSGLMLLIWRRKLS